MTFIRTSLLNAIAVIVKLLTFLGINKLLAIYVGPIGYAVLGQYQNLITMITTFASGAINTGVTKYTAEYYRDELKQQTLWQTAGTIAFIGSVFSSILMAVFYKQLAIFFLKNEEFATVFLWFAGSLIFFVFNALLLAILNGKKEVGFYVIANIAGSLLALAITALLVSQYGLYGALIGLAVYQSLTFFFSCYLCYKTSWFKFNLICGTYDPLIAKNLMKYAFMAIVSAVCVPGSQILVRNYIGNTISWDAAGFVEAMWRLSSAYLMLVTSTLAVYYLPKLSELDDAGKIKAEIVGIYKVVLPLVILCSSFIYFCRNIIINLLFTHDFIGMEELFAWQMIGDTLKITSWLLGYLYVAKGFFRLYIISEILFALVFFILVVVLENMFGLKSVALAHALTYFFYFFFVFYSLKYNRII
ncbi:MAG: O-antigen translocase [bacterium]|nr:O-antigen translocase [bacterium]